MRTLPYSSRYHPLLFISSVSAFGALIALMIALFTASGAVAVIAAPLVVALLVGSYLLERWARRRRSDLGSGIPLEVSWTMASRERSPSYWGCSTAIGAAVTYQPVREALR
jgi:hypothetical protein